ncbi:MAG: histidine phosphatase family protein [Alicyclobacillaceae bacterium]|nr:histidine phosphatase family protein [Alicyclobacillaceae bacterium]
MISLWMVRHGETEWNRQAQVQGWTNVPLSSAGVEQAHALGRMLEGVPFSALLSSDLCRAAHTADILRQYVGGRVTLVPEARERRFGAAEGLNRAEMLQRFPDGPPGAEPDAEFLGRAARFLDQIVTAYGTGRILCVSHGGFIRVLLRTLGCDEPPLIPNTSVTRLRWDKRWQVEVIGWAGHLSPDTDGKPAGTVGAEAEQGLAGSSSAITVGDRG